MTDLQLLDKLLITKQGGQQIMKRILVLVFISMQFILAKPNNYKLNGTVLDLITSKPLANVSVIISSRLSSKILNGTNTDEKGRFEFTNLTEANVRVKFSLVGYISQVIDSVSLGSTSRLGLIKLEPTTIEMKEVVIKSLKPMIEEHADRQVLNVDRMPGNSGTVTEVLKNSGLVDVDPSTNAITIRGEGVKIKMDGHESSMSGEMLNQMPATMLDQVEVILAPGAKESAEGGTYIINLITKKSQFDNFSGSLYLSSTTTKTNYAGIDINYKVDKLNVFMETYGYYYESKNESESERYVYNSPLMYYQNSKGGSSNYGMYGYAKFGFDYDFDAKNSLTVYATYNGSRYNYSMNNDNFVYNSGNLLQYGFNRTTTNESPNNDLTFYGFYKKQFEKRGNELTFDFMYTGITGTTLSDMDVAYSYIPSKPQIEKSDRKLDASTIVFKTDYSLPFNTDRLETGYSFTRRNRKNDYIVNDFSYLTNTWRDSLKLSNIFEYTENIHALYLTYAYKLDKFDIKFGLRGENLNTEGNQFTQQSNFRENYLSYFPNLNVSYKLSDLLQIGFNTFRRVTYPQMYYLNPFRQYNGPNTFFEGNSKLEPTYSNSYALNLSRYINLYYTKSTGIITNASGIENDSIMVSSYINLNKNESYGFDLTFPYYNSPMMPIHLPDFITMMNISFGGTFTKQTGKYLQQDLTMEDKTYRINANIGLKLWWDIDASIYFMYRPAVDNKLYKRNASHYSGIYLSKRFFDRKLNVSMSVINILNFNSYENQSYGSGYYTNSRFHMINSSGISISLSYSFNDYKQRNDRKIGDDRDKSGEGNSSL